jgi:glycosyltransferase involved in cell wall biosynthesis
MKPKLLVLECWGLGDLALATPFLRLACERYQVTLVAKPYATDLRPRFWPEVEVIPFAAPWTAFRNKYQLLQWPWPELARLVRRLRRERFDVGLSARWDPRDHALLRLAGARKRLGFPRAGSRSLLTQALAHPGPTAHQYECWRRMGEALGLPMPDHAVALPARAPGNGPVVIHSGAARPVRVWPLPRYLRLARELRAGGLAVRLACDPGQRRWWVAAGERDIFTPDDLPAMLDVLDGAAVFIGNDSGPGHLAAACGVPTFTLFGPQLPSRFAPLHRDADWVEGWNCPHRPCHDYCRLAQPYCLLELSEEQVAQRVDTFLSRHLGTALKPAPARPSAALPPVATMRDPAPEPVRVLCVSATVDLSGASRRLLRVVTGVDRRRFLPVMVLPEDGPLRELLEAEGLEVILLRSLRGREDDEVAPSGWRSLAPALRLAALLRRRRIGLVHTNSGRLLAPALAARWAGVPHIWHLREIWPPGSAAGEAWLREHGRLAQRLIAPSGAVAAPYEPGTPISVIPDAFGLDASGLGGPSRVEARAAFAVGDDFVIGAVGTLAPERKGLALLLEAAAQLLPSGLSPRVLLVGAPDTGREGDRELLRSRARELGLADRLCLAGELTDLRPAYTAMDVLALPSLAPEPFGGVLGEAMSVGLPVVATQHGGALDQVVPDKTGLLVPPADVSALASALGRLAHDPVLRERLGTAGRERMRATFDAGTLVRAVEEQWAKAALRRAG